MSEQQTFTIGELPRIILRNVGQDLEIHGWDHREISMEWDDHIGTVSQNENTLTILDCDSDIEIWTPYDTEVSVDYVEGDLTADHIRRIDMRNIQGDVELEHIGEDTDLKDEFAIKTFELQSDLTVRHAPSLRTERKIGGEAYLENVAQIQMDAVGGDVHVENAERISIGAVGGDLDIDGVSQAVNCGSIGGDVDLKDTLEATVTLGNVGNDLSLEGAASVNVGNIGNDADLGNVQGEVRLGNVGNDLEVHSAGSDLFGGRIGDDANLHNIAGSVQLGSIGNDLLLQGTFPANSRTNAMVGGDAKIILPQQVNASINALVGGSISGPYNNHNSRSRSGGMARFIYTSNEENTLIASINLQIGGDLQLHGGGTPHSSSSGQNWEFGPGDIFNLGELLSGLGSDFEASINQLGESLGKMGQGFGEDFGRKINEQVQRAQRKAEEAAKRAAEKARAASERARAEQKKAAERAKRDGERHRDRINVRINGREWQFNQELLSDLAARAQQAAQEGVAGALEAVEHSLRNLGMGNPPPRPPRSPQPPPPPHQPDQITPMPYPPFPSVPPTPPVPPAGWTPPGVPGPGWTPPGVPGKSPLGVPTGTPPLPPTTSYRVPIEVPHTHNVEQEEAEVEKAPENKDAEKSPAEQGQGLEDEREVILRMIVEGRLTPEEGDMLLEGLGS